MYCCTQSQTLLARIYAVRGHVPVFRLAYITSKIQQVARSPKVQMVAMASVNVPLYKQGWYLVPGFHCFNESV